VLFTWLQHSVLLEMLNDNDADDDGVYDNYAYENG
jgi:hypothetical protein